MMKNWLLALSGLSARAAPTVPRRNGTRRKLRFHVRKGGSALAGSLGIAALSHEVGDHAVESQSVVKALARQSTDAFDKFRSKVGAKHDLDRAAARQVEEPVILRD